jgi:hypothetical protein
MGGHSRVLYLDIQRAVEKWIHREEAICVIFRKKVIQSPNLDSRQMELEPHVTKEGDPSVMDHLLLLDHHHFDHRVMPLWTRF